MSTWARPPARRGPKRPGRCTRPVPRSQRCEGQDPQADLGSPQNEALLGSPRSQPQGSSNTLQQAWSRGPAGLGSARERHAPRWAAAGLTQLNQALASTSSRRPGERRTAALALHFVHRLRGTGTGQVSSTQCHAPAGVFNLPESPASCAGASSLPFPLSSRAPPGSQSTSHVTWRHCASGKAVPSRTPAAPAGSLRAPPKLDAQAVGCGRGSVRLFLGSGTSCDKAQTRTADE